MQKIVVICLILFRVCRSDQIDNNYSYEYFIRQYKRTHTGIEKDIGRQIFQRNYADILTENAKGANLIVNHYLDWNATQKAKFLTYRPQLANLPLSSPCQIPLRLFQSPSSFDWRTYDKVTPIKDQKSCGSCWAFAATAQFQSLIAIATNGTKYDLAQQYLIQCDSDSNGCNGGLPYTALKLANQTGIPLETQYPFIASISNYSKTICTQINTKKIEFNATISHVNNLTQQQIQQSLVSYGPLTVGVGAGNCNSFMSAGPKTSINCPSSLDLIDHAVLLIGYNSTHWIIKNSWNTQWGENGYGYIDKVNDAGLRLWVDIMQANKPWNPIPAPLPIPSPNQILLTITMSDTSGDGWNNIILGFKQDGVIVATFGNDFITGKSNGPISVRIPRNKITQIVVSKYGIYTEEIEFTIKAPNGTTIYKRASGSTFSSQAVFFVFCPAEGCPVTNNITYYLTVTDSYGDGWTNNILAFRQNGAFQTFGLPWGYSAGPFAFSFIRNVIVDIIVYTLGSYTKQCGFVIKTASDITVFQRKPGAYFFANTKFGSFNQGTIALAADFKMTY